MSLRFPLAVKIGDIQKEKQADETQQPEGYVPYKQRSDKTVKARRRLYEGSTSHVT